MAVARKRFQGVSNIVRFNWHFYAIAFALIALAIILKAYLIAALIFTGIAISLSVSCYIYDLSGLYKLNWATSVSGPLHIVNIHAGFDETSLLLQDKFKDAHLQIIDFYDPQKHTEVSIKRAREAHPALPQTIQAATGKLPLKDNTADKVFVIFSAHEIRDEMERSMFIKELARVIKPGGEIFITEHLRDLPNFLAYNIGFLHFYGKESWLQCFRDADLQLNQEIKSTPFISTFIMSKK